MVRPLIFYPILNLSVRVRQTQDDHRSGGLPRVERLRSGNGPGLIRATSGHGLHSRRRILPGFQFEPALRPGEVHGSRSGKLPYIASGQGVLN